MKRGTGNIFSNLDNQMHDITRRRKERDEWNTHVVEEAIRESSGYGFLGEYNPRFNVNGRPQVTITHDQKNWSASDYHDMKARGESPKAVFIATHDDGDYSWMLTAADEEACRQGYICENCIELQEFPNLPKCQSVRGFSCGHVRSIY